MTTINEKKEWLKGTAKLSKKGTFILLKNNNWVQAKGLTQEFVEKHEDEILDFVSKPFDLDKAKYFIDKAECYESYALDDLIRIYKNFNEDFDEYQYSYDFKTKTVYDDKERREKEYAEAQKQAEKRLAEEQLEKQRIIEKFSKMDPDEIMEMLDDDALYTNTTKDNTDGGYCGLSKSNRAIRAEKGNQFPYSIWGKKKIQELHDNAQISFSDDWDLNDWLMIEINKLSDKEIRENLLMATSWHHTGAFAKETVYYSLVDAKEIYYYILNRK